MKIVEIVDIGDDGSLVICDNSDKILIIETTKLIKKLNKQLSIAVVVVECCDICKEESKKGNKVNKICTNCIK